MQPRVTEALIREKGNIQCGLEGGKELNANCKGLIIVIHTVVIIGFAAVIFVLFKLYKHFEISYYTAMETTRFSAEEAEFRRLEVAIEECEGHEENNYSAQLCQENSLRIDSQWRFC